MKTCWRNSGAMYAAKIVIKSFRMFYDTMRVVCLYARFYACCVSRRKEWRTTRTREKVLGCYM